MMSRSIGENLKKKYFIFFELSPFEDLDFENLYSCNLKNYKARSFKLGQLIEDDEQINW